MSWLPWIRQRSRWLKGYALTWAVYMRAPKTLLQDMGLWQFFWRAIALRGYAVTVFIGAFTLDLLAGLSRPAPSLNGLHAKLGFLHIGRDLLNV